MVEQSYAADLLGACTVSRELGVMRTASQNVSMCGLLFEYSLTKSTLPVLMKMSTLGWRRQHFRLTMAFQHFWTPSLPRILRRGLSTALASMN